MPYKNKDDMKQYYQDNKEKIKLTSLEIYYRNKKQCLDYYGGKCSLCGISDYVVLDLDHIDNNGSSHRKNLTMTIYRWLIKEGFPPGFQVLCANCHRRKTTAFNMANL